MSDDWYVRKGQKTLGPVTEKQLRAALASRRITADAQVRRGLSGPWMAVGSVLDDPEDDEALVGAEDDEKDLNEDVDGQEVDEEEYEEDGDESPSRIPVLIVAVVGFLLLGGGLWAAFELGRNQAPAPPAVAAAPREPLAAESKSNVSGSPSRSTESPAVERAKAAIPATRQSTPATTRQATAVPRPSQSKTAPAAIPGAQSKPLTPSSSLAKSQSPPGLEKAIVQAEKAGAPVVKAAPVAKAAPVVVPKAAATDADLRALETTAKHSSTAKEAVALYRHFQATRTMSQIQQETFKSNLQVWEERARQNLVRLGEKWVAEAEASKAHDEAAQLFEQAYEMVKILNFEEARKTLEKASRVDPNSIAADFTLGILNSITPPSVRSPHTAAKHFQIVLRRIPGYVPALNNLAIAELHEEKYADGVRHLREAADRSPESEEVTQNLGRFVSEAQLGRIRPAKSVLSEATRVYSKTITNKEGTRAELKCGWRYMPLVTPKGEREGLARVQSPATEAISCIAQGTGFVVEPHYVLTCRHVVDDLTLGRADKIEIVDPTDPAHQRRLPAACVDVAQEDDLCLLRCDQLNVPAIALADKVPPRGTEVLLMGFPGGSGFGLGLKTTRGIVTALPGDVARINGPKWFDFSRKLWYDAASSHGASGGALCDEHGNVVAVHAIGYRPGDDPANAKYAGGVPAPNATAFLRTAIPNFAHPPIVGPALKWSEVDAKVSPSIVLIVVGYRKVAMVMAAPANAPRRRQNPNARQVDTDIYDDQVCTACNGRARIRCRAPGCAHGGVHDDIVVNDAVNVGPSNRPVIINNTTTQSVRRTCPVCHGTGYVQCPYCTNGYDPLLR
jgi:S1-C subfamily serine protease